MNLNNLPILRIHPEEADFLNFSRGLFEGNRRYGRDPGSDSGFKGLSGGGQEYLASLLNKKAIQYLLEKGGAVAGTVMRNGERVNNFSLLSHPLKPSFSRWLYHTLLNLYDRSRPLPPEPGFTCGDQVILLYLTERLMETGSRGYGGSEKFYEYVQGHAYIPRLVFPGSHNGGDSMPPALAEMFFKRPNAPAVLYGLRSIIRDHLARRINGCLESGRYQALISLGQNMQAAVGALFDWSMENGHPELLGPYCEACGMLFRGGPHSEDLARIVDRDVRPGYTSDRQKALDGLLPLYDWVGRLDTIHGKSLKSRAWDDDFEVMNVFKKSYRDISEQARQNARATVGYLENVV